MKYPSVLSFECTESFSCRCFLNFLYWFECAWVCVLLRVCTLPEIYPLGTFQICHYFTGEPFKLPSRRPQSAKIYSPPNDSVSRETAKNIYKIPERPKSDKYYSSPICRRISDVTVSDSSDSPCPSPHQYKGTLTECCVYCTSTCLLWEEKSTAESLVSLNILLQGMAIYMWCLFALLSHPIVSLYSLKTCNTLVCFYWNFWICLAAQLLYCVIKIGKKY